MSNAEYYRSEIERNKKALTAECEKEKAESAMKSLHQIYTACTEAGFSEEQAWYITKQILQKSLYEWD